VCRKLVFVCLNYPGSAAMGRAGWRWGVPGGTGVEDAESAVKRERGVVGRGRGTLIFK
jgi:hypothetical protein